MPQRKLAVRLITQEQSLWCWAANVDMVSDFFGNPQLRQCEIAEKQFNISNCGAIGPLVEDGTTSNQAVNPQEVKDIWAANNVGSTFLESSLSFESLKAEIDQGRPVQVAWLWDGDGGHVVIVKGYREDANRRFVFINDPLNENEEEEIIGDDAILYSQLLTAHEQGRWAYTWKDLARVSRVVVKPTEPVTLNENTGALSESLSAGNVTITIQVQIS
jgi:hypothetical protein